ncbi:TPA: hypothetical protein ACJULA_002551 [Staphylococcus aureus]|uniref:hypothetical protein n=1 Tax=Staphylococcaceae TaxID=90964 RepID=UPI001CC4E02B|nr:hypothetical protein [Staphylococcus aureus]MBZ5280822.1 hypothetical protein [Staphylococcus aureus]MDG6736509.1 hypothetical protein [Staphylococcus aureus]HCX2884250.1 hypothetical protein [Staphylococcus aureus]HDE6300857.1 hypothetical protein [Staphylococcus aureus]HDG4682633.1 hypothetical protein [Staphylococcus aureus]
MPVAEQNKQQLADKVEELIQSRNFGEELRAYDAYVYEEMVRDAMENKDIPDFIEPSDVEHELILTNKQSPEAWAETLTQRELLNEQDVKQALDDEEELVQSMLNEIEGNFDAEVEFKEELDEVLMRKPDVKTLSDELENNYDEYTFVEYLKENENELLQERLNETLQEEGFPSDVDKQNIEYSVDVSIEQSFDTLAERYLEEAREEENARIYAQENINEILEKEKAFSLDITIDSDAEDY